MFAFLLTVAMTHRDLPLRIQRKVQYYMLPHNFWYLGWGGGGGGAG